MPVHPCPELCPPLTKTFIYGLCHPRSLSVYYVGLSTIGKMRPYQHWSDALNRNKGSAPLKAWIVSLKEEGVRYQIRILEEVAEGDLSRAEARWIETLKDAGEPILNIASGGGRGPSKAGREVIRAKREKMGRDQMTKLLGIVGPGPCYLTDAELAQKMDISDRQVRKYLKRLTEDAILRKEVCHYSFAIGVRTRRILWPGESDAVSESEERSEEHDGSGTESPEDDF